MYFVGRKYTIFFHKNETTRKFIKHFCKNFDKCLFLYEVFGLFCLKSNFRVCFYFSKKTYPILQPRYLSKV